MKSFRNLTVLLFLVTFILSGLVWAKPVGKMDAEKAVEGWLKTDPKPLKTVLGGQIEATDVFSDEDGNPVYYIVYLNPSGFVIVSADDLIEPVVGFVSGEALYDPSPENPLGALVSRDLPGRVDAAKKLQKELDAGKVMDGESAKAQDKWNKLKKDDLIAPMGIGSVSDVRVAPLVQTKWGQDYVCNGTLTCYNYYTPNNWYCGCTATAMAQILRYREYPVAGIGVHQYGSYSTRGGDGSGGPYNYGLMIYEPGCDVTLAQRQQIGALCYDAGVAAYMDYGSGGSGAYIHDAKAAFLNTFQYTNAVIGGNESTNIGAGLNGMVNPNLDAGLPVEFGIYGPGHAVVCDGYGYQSSTLYHHVNMGWDGYDDAWYNLPTIGTFTMVDSCIYNLFTSGTGEIISGRVTNGSGVPISGATVTATGTGGPYTAMTNSNGIYALVKVRSATTYTISVTAAGYSFGNRDVTMGTSTDTQITSGNQWGVDFVPGTPPPVPGSITYPTSSSTGQYTVSWASSTGATSYQLERSSNGGGSWGQVYSGSNLSYPENIGNGSYRYRVKATNNGGSSGWRTGTYDCVVSILYWSESADYYVNGQGGLDTNPGSSSQPWATISKAITVATAGKKVLVWGGQTYTGALTLSKSGTSASPITFKRDPASGTATINGNGGTTGAIYSTTASYNVFDGFKLTNNRYGFYNYGAANGLIIKNCRITGNTQYGVYIRSGDNHTLFNDAIYTNGSTYAGVYVYSSALNNNVSQCSIYNHKWGVYYNTSCTGGIVTNSIIANHTTNGVRCASSSTCTVTYTDNWSNGTNYYGCSAGTGCISANPLWVSPSTGDFHLQAGSPCDNTGSDGGDMGYRYSTSAL